eukprot:12491532-Ditylum_brightwellii.AAC.1
MPALNHWLQHNIQRVAAQGSIKVDLSLQDYKDLFKSQAESTSSSPSGRHYGHYRAAIVSDTISQVHASMMSIPFLMGFTSQRWQTAIDVMLEKVIWNRRLVPVAETSDMLSPVQFGNRQGCTALDALLLKV